MFNEVTEILQHPANTLTVSFSGGETSAMMAALLMSEMKEYRERICVIFANTGQENEETLEFVDRCDRAFGLGVVWVEAVVHQQQRKGTTSKLVTFETAARDGEPFKEAIAKFGIPNVSFPFCSRELKKRPIRHRQKLLGFGSGFTAIGIRADEFDRVSSEAQKERLLYPLIAEGITKQDVNTFWREQPFRLDLKGYEGNCKTCWKKSLNKLCKIYQEGPEKFDFFQKMEDEFSRYRPPTQPNRPLPSSFFRGNRTVADIASLAGSREFDIANDAAVYTTHNRYSDFVEMNAQEGCGESCEAF